MVILMEESYVSNQESLKVFCKNISESEWLAIDTEFIREKTFFPELSLIQVCNKDFAAVIDIIKIKDLKPLLDILYNGKIIKIFHAGNQDLEIFFNNWNQIPLPIFDTQPAAALLGYGDQIGYAKLVKSLLSVDLKKDQSRTNWLTRPLSKEQIRYALDDVIYLGDVYLQLRSKLCNAKRLHWLVTDFIKLTDPAVYCPDPFDFWKKIKGKKNLNGKQLAALRLLAQWREKTARMRNLPRNWVIKDNILVEISRQFPQTLNKLNKINGIEQLKIENDKKELITLINQASNLNEDQRPEVEKTQRRLSVQQEAMVGLLNACLHLIASKHQLSPQAIATNKDLQKFVIDDEGCKLNEGWRRDIAGNYLTDIKNGKINLINKDGKLELK